MIQSNVSIAQKHASQLKEAAYQLKKQTNGEVDERTTLQGNRKAKTSYSKVQGITLSYGQALEATITNIHQAAKEFEAMDQSLTRGFHF
ncbi:TIGR04197 family type VII secretion effector [Listeria aquatica]|uniref:TIGR04197 family type VII secretion effector n=1 Tax=Listeria aquatica TaxID=1494960 RepID=UPI0031F5B016